MARKKFYIKVDDTRNLWYQFNAPETAYPDAVGIALGVSATLPAGGRVTTRGTFAHYPIVRVRIKLEDSSSRVRLCDLEMLQTAIEDLPTAAAFNSTVTEVKPVRRNLSI
jgi:hypothetical protein